MGDQDLVDWFLPRGRLFGIAMVFGAVSGSIVTGLVLLWLGDLQAASSRSFALGSLVFAFGILGWSAAVFVGGGHKPIHEVLGFGPDWTEHGARRAMSVLTGIGAGAMIGVSVTTAVLGFAGY